MRTSEQIGNLRKVISYMHGPVVGRMLHDDEVNSWADSIQHHVDSKPHLWEVRIKIGKEGNPSPTHWMEFDWSAIAPEPKKPSASKIVISNKCMELLKKYPAIQCIKVNIVDSPNDMHLFHR